MPTGRCPMSPSRERPHEAAGAGVCSDRRLLLGPGSGSGNHRQLLLGGGRAAGRRPRRDRDDHGRRRRQQDQPRDLPRLPADLHRRRRPQPPRQLHHWRDHPRRQAGTLAQGEQPGRHSHLYRRRQRRARSRHLHLPHPLPDRPPDPLLPGSHGAVLERDRQRLGVSDPQDDGAVHAARSSASDALDGLYRPLRRARQSLRRYGHLG